MKRFWIYFGILIFLALLGSAGPSLMRWYLAQGQPQPSAQTQPVVSATQQAAVSAWKRLYDPGMAALDAGHLDEAERDLQDAMVIAKGINPEGEEVALTHGLLADLYGNRMDRARDEYELREAIRILAKIVGPDNGLLGFKTIKLAKNLISQKRLDEAETVLNEADRICKAQPAGKEQAAMRDIANVGWIMLRTQQGRSEEILALCESTLASYEQRWGAQSVHLQDPLGVMVISFDEAGKMARAEELQKRFLAIVAQRYGESDDLYADGMRFLSGIQVHQGKFAEAEATIRRMIQIESARYGARGPIAAGVIADLTHLYIDSGQLDLAMQTANQVIVMAPRMEFSYRDRSYVYFVQGQFNEAWDDIQRSLAIEPKLDSMIWAWVVACRRGMGPDTIESIRKYVDRNGIKAGVPWPSPILVFAAGRMSEDELLAATQVSNQFKRRNDEAYACFVLGSKCLGEGDKAGAVKFFQRGAATHAVDCFEYRRMVHELSNLNGAATVPATQAIEQHP